MADTRPKVLALAFTMLTTASIVLIANEGAVSANAWALLALSGIFATTAVIGFSQNGEVENTTNQKHIEIQDSTDTENQNLPDPAETGFDVPVI